MPPRKNLLKASGANRLGGIPSAIGEGSMFAADSGNDNLALSVARRMQYGRAGLHDWLKCPYCRAQQVNPPYITRHRMFFREHVLEHKIMLVIDPHGAWLWAQQQALASMMRAEDKKKEAQ